LVAGHHLVLLEQGQQVTVAAGQMGVDGQRTGAT
jgi:hypothetical protein